MSGLVTSNRPEIGGHVATSPATQAVPLPAAHRLPEHQSPAVRQHGHAGAGKDRDDMKAASVATEKNEKGPICSFLCGGRW